MVIALAKTGKIPVLADVDGPSESLVNRASVVKKHAPELVTEVLAGTIPLEDAYKQARRNAPFCRWGFRVFRTSELPRE
jgi:hypothetical protein